MLKKYSCRLSILTLLFQVGFSSNVKAQTTVVDINMNCQRYIGGVSALDRNKYFSIHDTGNDTEQAAFRTNYNVTGGRGFWGPSGYSNQQFKNPIGTYPAPRVGNDLPRKVIYNEVLTEHPKNAFLDLMDVNKAGDWVVEYFKNFSNDNGRPEYYEPMNEPFVHARDFYSGGWNSDNERRIREQMAKLYNAIGQKVKDSPALVNMKIIGYSAAWPSMELSDFGHWKDNQKMFMDTAGDNMYAFSTHLYDGINITGQDTKRSGSNSEAILDLIEAYSFIKWNKIKPHAITEYGAIEQGYGTNYSDIASVQTVKSINHILFNLLERQDHLAQSTPFMTGKATWHITAANNYQPYGAALWKPSNIGQPNPTGWVYTPRIFFYELWKDVKGNRISIKSGNPDIQAQAFVDGKKMYVAFSNLDDANQTVNLNMISSLEGLVNVKIKDLKVYDQTAPSYNESTVTQSPNTLSLIKSQTVILEYTFNKDITFSNALRENKYYSSTYLQPITAKTPISFNFNAVATGFGIANLRMSIGRKHNVTKSPIVKVNGIVVAVPTNWAGYNQANRDDFFGMISIPFSSGLLKANNTVTVEFPDAGGTISSMILSVENYDVIPNTLGIQTFSATCVETSNGQVNITPYVANAYKVTISGNGVNATYDFSSDFQIKNLASGTYSLNVTIPSSPSFKEEYKVAISQPQSITVVSKLNKATHKISLDLTGSDSYIINLNGLEFTTTEQSVELPLDNGINSVMVKTAKDCQGVYNENIILDSATLAHPNPFKDRLTVDLDSDDKVNIAIYSNTGIKVYSKEYLPENKQVKLDLAHLSNGIYIMALESNNSNKQIKLIKQ